MKNVPPFIAIDSLQGLDDNLNQRSVQNFISSLHRRFSRKKVNDIAEEMQLSIFLRPHVVLDGLKQAIESGIADNYTYHFAYTALVLYMEMEKQCPEILNKIIEEQQKPNIPQSLFKNYCQKLIEENLLRRNSNSKISND